MDGCFYQPPEMVDYNVTVVNHIFFGGIAMRYDVIIVGAGPGGIFSAYELSLRKPELKVAVPLFKYQDSSLSGGYPIPILPAS